ncbi:MAG TPA: ferritin-like domain-containing protein [Longimicrobium sp.]
MDTDMTQPGGGVPPVPVSDIIDGLNDLLQLDHDAIGAYDVAIEKLADRDHANQILGFRRDHERHIQELNELIASLGGEAKNQPHLTGPFKQALQSLGAVGGDRGVLAAFRQNELQVRSKYELYAAKANHWPQNLKRAIDRNALDEERHYRWVADAMQAMGVGMGEGPEIDAATAAREKALVTGTTVENAVETIVEVAGVARERIVDAAGTARERLADVAGTARERATELAGTARERAAELAGTARERATELAGTTRERVSGLAETVRGGVADGTTGAGNRISGLLDMEEGPLAAPVGRVRGGVGTARQGAVDATSTLEARIRDKPVQTLLMAGVAGFVVGRLLR